MHAQQRDDLRHDRIVQRGAALRQRFVLEHDGDQKTTDDQQRGETTGLEHGRGRTLALAGDGDETHGRAQQLVREEREAMVTAAGWLHRLQELRMHLAEARRSPVVASVTVDPPSAALLVLRQSKQPLEHRCDEAALCERFGVGYRHHERDLA